MRSAGIAACPRHHTSRHAPIMRGSRRSTLARLTTLADLFACRDAPRMPRALLDVHLTGDSCGVPARVVAVTPEPQVDRGVANLQAAQGQIGKPVREQRIDMESTVRRIRLKPEDGLQQMEHGSSRPRLRNIGARIQDWERAAPSLEARIQFWQPVA